MRAMSVTKIQSDAQKCLVFVAQVSRRVKGLREAISAAKHEAGQLTAEQQHLRRQQSSLQERMQRLQHQVIPPFSVNETRIESKSGPFMGACSACSTRLSTLF